MSIPTLDRVRRVRERAAEGLAALEHPEWAEAFPWLIQGTTTRGSPDRPFDFRLFGPSADARASLASWASLRLSVGADRIVHARQVHGSVVRVHGLELLDHSEAPDETAAPGPGSERRQPSGLHLADPCDAHVTAQRGLLLAVTTADCVPVFAVDADRQVIGLAHAGWRGTAGGVLEHTLEAMAAAEAGDRSGAPGRASAAGPDREPPGAGVPRASDRDRQGPSDLSGLHVHLGPAVCGRCYEVGPEVFRALGLPEPAGPEPLDLRAALAERAVARGVRPERITISEHCTRCTDSGLFSHRGGDAGRQVGYLGLRPPA